MNGQSRDPAENVIANEIANYLEGDNADFDTNFITTLGNAFTKHITGEKDPASGDALVFNDKVLFLTRQELMSAVEKRVLGEASRTLLINYQAVHNAFPWLSIFDDPSTSSFKGTPGTWEGHIPYHSSLDTPGASNRNPFVTQLDLSWLINNANLAPAVGTYINDNALLDSSFNDPVFGVNDPVSVANATCNWTNRNTVDCTGTHDLPQLTSCIPGTCPPAIGISTCDRTYTFDIQFVDNAAATAVNVNDPTATSVRTRDVTSDIASLTGVSNGTIQIDDTYTSYYPPCGPPTPPPVIDTETRTLTINVGVTTGTMNSQGIHYDIDTDGLDLNADDDYDDADEFSPELPEWFVKNNWHQLVLIAYPGSEVIPGGAVTCVVGTDCLVLNGAGGTNNNNRAIAIIAGEDLTPASPRPNNDVTDYLEAENTSSLDGVLEKRQYPDNVFNDQVKIISTAP